ncbi:hypothetical protein DN602_30250, partial [Raoultella ornithinolytica]
IREYTLTYSILSIKIIVLTIIIYTTTMCIYWITFDIRPNFPWIYIIGSSINHRLIQSTQRNKQQ